MRKYLRLSIKVILWVFTGFILLFIALAVSLRFPKVQNFVVQKITNYLEEKIHTPVHIGYVHIEFPKKLSINDIYLEDQKQDTLFAGEKLRVDINMFKLLSNTVELKQIDLVGITAKINRDNKGTFNFDYIVDAFVDPNAPKEEDTTSTNMQFDLGLMTIKNTHFSYDDQLEGIYADAHLKNSKIHINEFVLEDNMRFGIPLIDIDGLRAEVRQWAPEGLSIDSISATNDSFESSAELLPDILLKNIQLTDIKVAYSDSTSALHTGFDFDKVRADIKEIDLNGEFVNIGNLEVDGSQSSVIFAKQLKDKIQGNHDTTASSEPMNWVVQAKSIVLKETGVAFLDENEARTKGLDYFNMNLSDFHADLKDLYFSMDSIAGSLKTLAVKDHSGFEIKELHGDFMYTNQGAELKDLLIETPHTVIKDYFYVKYPSLEALDKDMGVMELKANIDKSTIDMRDVYLLAPFIDTMEVVQPLLDKKFYIHGKAEGKLKDLRIPNIELSTLQDTRLLASLTIKGLPDPDKLWMDLDLKELKSSRADLKGLIAPSLLPDSIEFPLSMNLNGKLTGGAQGFTTLMDLKTEQGNASVDGTLDMSGSDTLYNANIVIHDFHLGEILKQDSVLGKLSTEVQLKGQGLDPKTLNAEITGKLNLLEAMGYGYKDIDMQVSADNGRYHAIANSPDSNIDLNLDLSADLSGVYPAVSGELMVDSINLKNLGLMEDDIRYHGKVDIDLSSADIDHLNGKVDIINSSIAYNEERIALDTVRLLAKSDSTKNLLLLNSPIFSAHMVGQYKLSQIANSMQDVVRVFYNPENLQDTLEYDRQVFEFSASLKNTRILNELLPDLEKMENITIDARFDSDEKSIMGKLVAPEITYSGTEVKNITADIITADSSLYYSMLIEKVKSGNIELINSTISGDVIENNLNFGLWIKDKNEKEQYHLGAHLTAEQDNYRFSLLPDGLKLNYQDWDVDENNYINISDQGILVGNFHLGFEDQKLAVHSLDSVGDAPLHFDFQNFRLETFTEAIATEDFSFGGGLNGEVSLERIKTNPVFVSELHIDRFYFGKDTVGDIDLIVNNEQENTYAADIRIHERGNDVQLLGKYYAPPSGENSIDATIDLKPFKMKTLQAFSFGNLKNSDGDLTGQLKITGDLDNPKIIGDINFENVQTNISMLNATFFADKQKITFNNQGISFPNFQLKDNRGNLAKINGSLRTANYQDFALNLTITADDFEAVNSTREDNDLFYGKLYASANIRITGDVDNPKIDGSVKADDKTDFFIVVPNDNPGISDREGVVKFVNKSDTLNQHNVFARLDSITEASKLAGFDMNLAIQTDPKARFTIILDEGSEEGLSIQGTAELNATIDASEHITLSGNFTVEDGEYSFNFGPITRNFNFQKGSTITWNGDPFDGQMNITALYKDKFPTLELVQNQVGAESQNLYKQRIPFDVQLILNGELMKPDITFNIDLDENNAIASQDVINKVNIALNGLREDPAEMNKQVFSLIILKRFMSSNPFESLSGGGGAEEFARSSVTSLLNSQLNALASDLITGVELDFNLQSEQDYTTGTGANRTDLNIGVSKMLFDDRLKITVGSNFEVEGSGRPGEKATNIAGDISLDYQLSKDGRYFARVYRKNQYQATLQGQYVETGIGFIINMNYDKFRELFMSSRALQNYYNPESRSFRRRFDVERMETDSVYRDSVRQVIRDSLIQHNPRYQERIQERRRIQQERQQQLDSIENQVPLGPDDDPILDRKKAVRNEETENTESQ